MRREPLLAAAGSIALTLTLAACSIDAPPSAPHTVIAAGGANRELTSNDGQLDVPLSGLTSDQLDRFNRGRAVFSRVFTDANGFGPSFNSTACASCHEEPSVGGFGDDLDEDVETHVSVESNGACLDLAAFGGAVIQHHTTAALNPPILAIFGADSVPGGNTRREPHDAGALRLRASRRDTGEHDPRAR